MNVALTAPKLDGAVCVDYDPETFYPATGDEATAKGICARCPVQRECLQWALSNGEDWGIWGGLDEHERVNLKRRMRRQAAGA